jgi:cardiolipin synthase C
MWLVRVVLVAFAALASGCGGAAPPADKVASFAPTDTEHTYLARQVATLGDPHDGRSGIYLLSDGPEALAMRLLLTEKAERSIDVQYYILTNDTSGQLIAGELLKAAERGVHVRVLLDDMYAAGYDLTTAALAGHPNMQIRLFNPFRRDIGRMLGGLVDFQRVNRRMHNKSMTFDNQVTIVGGRNLADEYFAAREDTNYDDLDVLAAGPAAREASASFDDYWNSPYAVPAEAAILAEGEGLSLDEARARLMGLYETARHTSYGAALTHDIRRTFSGGRLDLTWAPARVVADPPEKAAGVRDDILTAQMRPLVAAAQDELVVATAYFVPGPRGVALLSDLARRGVHVVVLTNSLESNDVEPVHGHYARYRKALLEAGVELWELRPDRTRTDRRTLALGQSLSGLHAKAFVVDRRQLFVGSFNWDPRSVEINTEMGLLIDSPAMAGEVAGRFQADLSRVAYRLRLDEAGDIEWLERQDDGSWIAYGEEPSDSPWHTLRTRVYGILPIGSLL